MQHWELKRREFIKGCCASAALGLAGPAMLFSPEATAAENPYDTLVLVFLRGGLDGLNLVPPLSGVDRAFYEQARPGLAIANSGAYAGLPLTLAGGGETGFGLHPSATGLRDLWNDGKLAIVHACGMLTVESRSHFDAQLYLDLGTPGQHGGGTGWMTRAWSSQPAPGAASLPLLGVSTRQPNSLMGSASALSMANPSDFALNAGAWQWQRYRSGMPAGTRGLNETLGDMWAGPAMLDFSGQQADASLKLIGQQPYTNTLPAGWPTSGFAKQLWTIAQSIRFNLGLRYATLDLGGWDTHDSQGTAGSGYHYYQNKIAELSQALSAFYADLAAGGEAGRVTIVVQSEFGRRVRQNGSAGTDHGYGNPLLVLGGAVNGRRFYGNWPGLDPAILAPYFGDLPVTTDYRRILGEILIRRMANNQLSTVFPGYTAYAPLGIMRGVDLPPNVARQDIGMQTMAATPAVTAPRESAMQRQPAGDLPAERGKGRGERMLVRRGL